MLPENIPKGGEGVAPSKFIFPVKVFFYLPFIFIRDSRAVQGEGES
jgi:hypothetical protein